MAAHNSNSSNSHAFKAAQSLSALSASALSAAHVTSFYDMPSRTKNNSVEDNNEAIDGEQPSTVGLESRIAELESIISERVSELSSDTGENSAEIRALKGELKTFHISLSRVKEMSDQLMHEVTAHSNTLNSEMPVKATQVDQKLDHSQLTLKGLVDQIDGQLQAETAKGNTHQEQLIQHTSQLILHENTIEQQRLLINRQQEYIESLEQKMNKRLDQLENTTKKGFNTVHRNVEEGMEQLASDLLLHIGAEVSNINQENGVYRDRSQQESVAYRERSQQESVAYRDRSQQRLNICWKDAKDAIAMERQKTHAGFERFEEQVMQTVETIVSLKRAMEGRCNELEQHVSVAHNERNKMNKRSHKWEERVESLDREISTSEARITPIGKQAWEAVRLATDCKDDVRKITTKMAKLIGSVTQSRESTLLALSQIREKG